MLLFVIEHSRKTFFRIGPRSFFLWSKEVFEKEFETAFDVFYLNESASMNKLELSFKF